MAATVANEKTGSNSKYEMNRVLVLNDQSAPRLSPALAEEIGFNESILFLQLEFWIAISGHERDGRRWTYQSLSDLERFFRFWSRPTINRAVHSLLKQNLIFVSDEYNRLKYDSTRWFAINFDGVRKLKSIAVVRDETTPYQNETGSAQDDTRSTQNVTTIPETTTKITSENSPEITSRYTPPRPLFAVAEGNKGGRESELEDSPSRYTAGGGSVTDESESVVALDAFESVGVTSYAVTLKDERGARDEAKFHELSASELRDRLPTYLAANAARPESFIVRPRGASLIQVDDLKPAALSRIEPFSFLTVETSAGNYQAWVALNGADEATRSSVRRRLIRGVGGDVGATGAMRMCGSVNRKPERNGFQVRVRCVSPFKRVTVSSLLDAGLLAEALVPVTRPAPKPTGKPYRFPSYDKCLAGKESDRSRADASFLAICRERGFTLEDAVAELGKVSERVQDETVRGRGKEYLRLTAKRVFG